MKDIIIVGGGIVGMATAYKLITRNPALKISVIEKESFPGKHQTGNNSGVIHSGLYYKPGSLKARNCVDGYHQLINFAEENGIDFEICGKIVVATTENELSQLSILQEKGIQNGLQGIRILEKAELKEHEPHVSGLKGLYVPQTGIISYTDVVNKLAEIIEQSGVELIFNTRVTNIHERENITIDTERETYHTRLLINCAGLYSDKVASMSFKHNIRIIPFRGEYYKLKESSNHLVKNLIYPVPNPNFPFLGVHFTRMIKGGIEAGPNAVLAFKREGYKKSDINPSELFESLCWPGFIKIASKYWKVGMYEMYRSFSRKAFTKALQKLVPEIQESDLEAGGAGVRAQACDSKGGLLDDFYILEDKHSVHICNAPSPAATSSLSIGDTIAKLVLEKYSQL